MRRPGPPRVTTVGHPVELTPRAPERDAAYRWHILDASVESAATAGSGPVTHLTPDVPGMYHLELGAPDDCHEQTVRAFPDDRYPAMMAVPAAILGPASSDEVTVIGPFNDRLVGRDRPCRVGDDYILDVGLPSGMHPLRLAPHDGLAEQVHGDVEVPRSGRSRVRLDGRVGQENNGDPLVVADMEAVSDAEEAALVVEFLFDDRDALDSSDCKVRDDRLCTPVGTPRGVDSSEPVRVHIVVVQTTAEPGESDEPYVRHSIFDILAVDPGIVADRPGSGLVISRPANVPEWAYHVTVCEVFVRSFAGKTSDPTFDELTQHVPCLESLGMGCLQLMSILGSCATHGYHVTDYFDIAPDLDSREDFEALVE